MLTRASQAPGDAPSPPILYLQDASTKEPGHLRYCRTKAEGCIQHTPAPACLGERSPLFGNSRYSHKNMPVLFARAKTHVTHKGGFAQSCSPSCWWHPNTQVVPGVPHIPTPASTAAGGSGDTELQEGRGTAPALHSPSCPHIYSSMPLVSSSYPTN